MILALPSFQIKNGGIYQKRWYIPDVLEIYQDGRKELIEVKPSGLTNKEINQFKFIAAREYCKQGGILFKIITEKDLKKLLI